MSTVGAMQVRRQSVSVADGATSAIVWFPVSLKDVTLYAVGGAAASFKVEESFSTEEQIRTGTGVTWSSIVAGLDSVGTTPVKQVMTYNPCALKVTQLSAGKTGTLVVVW